MFQLLPLLLLLYSTPIPSSRVDQSRSSWSLDWALWARVKGKGKGAVVVVEARTRLDFALLRVAQHAYLLLPQGIGNLPADLIAGHVVTRCFYHGKGAFIQRWCRKFRPEALKLIDVFKCISYANADAGTLVLDLQASLQVVSRSPLASPSLTNRSPKDEAAVDAHELVSAVLDEFELKEV
ncbi:hypothetical protein T439DRAFT_336307 [Meredithblackwellia eburnea MCA 4105]